MMVCRVSSSPPARKTREMTGEASQERTGETGCQSFSQWRLTLPATSSLKPVPQARFHWESQSLWWKYTVTLGHMEEINCSRDTSKAINQYKIRPHQASSWRCVKRDKKALDMFAEYGVPVWV